MRDKLYYVYEDWTNESEPRCFYIGKGSLVRVKKIKRNMHHVHVAKNLGLERKIVLITDIEWIALSYEKYLIAERNTFNGAHNMSLKDIRCNRTVGGEGTTGKQHSVAAKAKMSSAAKGRIHSPESRKKMSDALKGKPSPNKGNKLSKEACAAISKANSGENHPLYGKGHSEASKKKMSESKKGCPGHNKGKKFSDITKKKISDAKKGKPNPSARRPQSEESRKKISMATKGRIPWNKGMRKQKTNT